MCARVIEIFTLKINPGPAYFVAQALRQIQGRRTADIVLQIIIHLGDEFWILAIAFIGLAQLRDRFHQRLGNKDTTVAAKMTIGIGITTNELLLRFDIRAIGHAEPLV